MLRDFHLRHYFSATFKKKDGTEISYMEYFETKYGLKITELNQPLLFSNRTNREQRGLHLHQTDFMGERKIAIHSFIKIAFFFIS